MDDEDDISEVAFRQQVARLQETICYLLRRNEELRDEVRELMLLRTKTADAGR
jgi:hypothetical protein